MLRMCNVMSLLSCGVVLKNKMNGVPASPATKGGQGAEHGVTAGGPISRVREEINESEVGEGRQWKGGERRWHIFDNSWECEWLSSCLRFFRWGYWRNRIALLNLRNSTYQAGGQRMLWNMKKILSLRRIVSEKP
jgi:hypothetical protein